jgi:outer membrane protein TolC
MRRTALAAIAILPLSFTGCAATYQEATEADLPLAEQGLDPLLDDGALGERGAGSGTDPVIVMLGLRLPVWTYAYSGAEEEARSEGAAFHADAIDASNRAEAALEQALSAIRDADRRISLYRDTLIPQAESAYASVVGAYQTGRSTVAATLMAQRELLDLQLGLVRAQTAHAAAWARLEQIVGQEVEPRRDTHE